MSKDVFLCHASEDKAAVVRPFVAACANAGISCWVDEAEILWGDSITAKVNGGIEAAKFVVVVLSEASASKNWPKREINAVLNMEASSGEVRILPLLVGDAAGRKKILKALPLLNDKSYLVWDGDPSKAVAELAKRLGKRIPHPETVSGGGRPTGTYRPQIKKRFSDRDRDRFLKDAFNAVREYFRQAAEDLIRHHSEIECDVEDVTSRKFTCKAYVDGKLQCQCKIWIGGMVREDAICFSEGWMNAANDNSYNEILTVVDDGEVLFLKATIGSMGSREERKGEPRDVAESLWRRFCRGLEQ